MAYDVAVLVAEIGVAVDNVAVVVVKDRVQAIILSLVKADLGVALMFIAREVVR